MPERIVVFGMPGDGALDGRSLVEALGATDLVVGAKRHLEALRIRPQRTLTLDGDLGTVLDAIAVEPGRVCVLASGDPGFFGIVRPLSQRFGPAILDVRPAPSSVALAFARLGIAWDDATVVSAHGRRLDDAVEVVARASKVAVLVSPQNSPEALGRALVGRGASYDRVVVCTKLGTDDEALAETDLAGLAAHHWDPCSVVVLIAGPAVSDRPSLAWGLGDDAFVHRSGMITKAEVRALALGKLELPRSGIFWDIGAGSGSVAIEVARLRPSLEVIALERNPSDAARIRENAIRHDVEVRVVTGEAPSALAELGTPDRVFVGGGGLLVLDAVLARLGSNGRVVASYAALDRAAAAGARLGGLVEVSISRGERLDDGGLRLVAQNPVFVAWGPLA